MTLEYDRHGKVIGNEHEWHCKECDGDKIEYFFIDWERRWYCEDCKKIVEVL